MAQISMTSEELENTFREAVLKILKLPMEDAKTVRFPYGSSFDTGSAPDFKRTENVCFIYLLPAEDGYGQLSHITYRDDGRDKLTRVDEHTDVHKLNFVCYGPQADSWARAIKAGFLKENIRIFLGRNHLFLVSHSFVVTHIPELKDGDWWSRCDAAAHFYQYVRLEEADDMETIESVRIIPAQERSK